MSAELSLLSSIDHQVPCPVQCLQFPSKSVKTAFDLTIKENTEFSQYLYKDQSIFIAFPIAMLVELSLHPSIDHQVPCPLQCLQFPGCVVIT